MLEYLTLILLCELAGEFIVELTHLPVPGPVAGMLLLFAFLVVKGSVPEELNAIASTLLNNLSLLFVPAGVGVMVHIEILGAAAVPLSVALVISTVLTIAVTAVMMKYLSRATSADQSESQD